MSNTVVNAPATNSPAKVVKFITINELKVHFSVAQIGIVRNPKTDKLFADLVGAGIRLKVQQDLDITQPMRFLFEDGLLDEGCIVNITADNTIAVL